MGRGRIFECGGHSNNVKWSKHGYCYVDSVTADPVNQGEPSQRHCVAVPRIRFQDVGTRDEPLRRVLRNVLPVRVREPTFRNRELRNTTDSESSEDPSEFLEPVDSLSFVGAVLERDPASARFVCMSPRIFLKSRIRLLRA